MRIVTIALLALICSVPARAHAADKKAEKNWKSKCASCHGKDGKGHTDQGKKMGVSDLTTAAYKKSKTDDQIKAAITDGAKGKGDAVMDGFKDKLDPAAIDALVKYVRALK